MGLLLGSALALAARAGRRPPRDAASLLRPMVRLLLVTGAGAALAGVIGWLLAAEGWVILVGPLAEQIPRGRHVAFLTAAWGHSASYLVSFIGGIVLVVSVWRSRRPPVAKVPVPSG